MGFLAVMLKRFVMFGLVALWVAMSAFQASAAVSAGGSHHDHAGRASASMLAASMLASSVAADAGARAGHQHAGHKHEANAHGHHGETAEKAGSPLPCHTPDSAPAGADMSCCAAMCQATDVVPVIFSMTGETRGASYSPALIERALPFAAAGLERPPR